MNVMEQHHIAVGHGQDVIGTHVYNDQWNNRSVVREHTKLHAAHCANCIACLSIISVINSHRGEYLNAFTHP